MPFQLGLLGVGLQEGRLRAGSYLGTLDIGSRILGFSPRAPDSQFSVYLALFPLARAGGGRSKETGQVESMSRQGHTQFSRSWGAGIRQIWLFPHHPSLGYRRLVMINKTNNYPVITDCKPRAGATAEQRTLGV